jgi:hypothetical protein
MQNLFRRDPVSRGPSGPLGRPVSRVERRFRVTFHMFYEERCRGGVSFLADRFLLATPVIGCQHAMMSCVKAAATRLSQLQQYFGRNRNRRSGALDIDYISVVGDNLLVAVAVTSRHGPRPGGSFGPVAYR